MVGSSVGTPGDGHKPTIGVDGAPAELETKGEAYWLRLWAFGRSPYGLGIRSDEEFWNLGYPEYNALRSVYRQHLRRWALERSMFANVWRKADAPPFFPEDFLDAGSREKRVAEHEQMQREVAAANASLARITQGAPPTDDVPGWARATRTEA